LSSDKLLEQSREYPNRDPLMSAASARIVRIVLAVMCFPWFSRADTIDSTRLLEVIRAHEANQERRIRNARWQVKGQQFHLVDPANPEKRTAMGDPKTRGKTKVLFEPPSGRYRVDIEYVAPWADGDDDYAAGYDSYSFDGESQRHFAKSQGGEKLPGADVRGDGVIGRENPLLFVDQDFGRIGYFPPNHFGLRFSSFLQQRIDSKAEFSAEARADGIWVITTTPPPHFALEQDDDFRIGYDPIRGLVVWAEAFGKARLRNQWAGKLWRRHSIKWREIEKDTWVPESYEWTNLVGRRATRIEYVDLKINQAINEKEFTIQFPVGTRVVDEIEKKMYTVSAGVIDEQQAIRDFMEHERLRERAAPKSFWQKWKWHALSIGVLAAMLFLCLIAWRRRAARTAAVATILAVSFAAPGAHSAEPDQDGSWRVSHAKGDSFAISQCGLNVALFTLEHFGTKYDLKSVSLNLPPSEKGICLSDIRNVLEAYGLEVIARDNVSISEIRRALQPGVLALFPTQMNKNLNHYFVALAQPERGRILVDPPNTVRAFDDSISETQWRTLGGAVLFVRCPKVPRQPQAAQISVTPSSFDLGKFDPDDHNAFYTALPQTIVLENKSDAAVLVAVRSPCGCMKPSWAGGIIAAGAKRAATIKVLPASWGADHKRLITLAFADGSSLSIPITAQVLPSKAAPTLSVDPAQIRVSADNVGPKNTRIERSVFVTPGPSSKEKLHAVCSKPWLSALLTPTDDSTARLQISIDLGAVQTASFPLAGSVEIADDDGHSAVVQVLVTRTPGFAVAPAILECRRSSTESQQFVLSPAKSGSIIPEGFAVLSAPAGISVEISAGHDRKVLVCVKCSPRAPLGVHTIRCRIGPEAGASQTVSLPINVRE
jgi:hypothetical protein